MTKTNQRLFPESLYLQKYSVFQFCVDPAALVIKKWKKIISSPSILCEDDFMSEWMSTPKPEHKHLLLFL